MSVGGGDTTWVGKKPLRRVGGLSDARSIAADLGFSVPPPPSQEDMLNLSTGSGEKGDDLIWILRELTAVHRNITDLQVELQGRKEDKNVAHLTHVSEMEKKIETLARITTILKDVLLNKPIDHLVSTKKARTSESGASNTSSNQDASLYVDLNEEEEETHPMGHKATKRKGKGKMKSDIEGMTINLDNMLAKFTEYTSVKKVEIEMKQKQLEVEEMKTKAALAKVQLKEYTILSKDTSQMTEEQLIIHEHLCERIRGRWNM